MGLTPYYVWRLLIAGAKAEILLDRQVPKENFLNTEHLDYIVADATLKAWQPYSLKQRALLFHRQFPDKFVSSSKLREIYL